MPSRLPLIALLASASTMAATTVARGQDVAADAVADAAAPAAESQVLFEADRLTYDDETGIVTADGLVTMSRDGYDLRADQVIYNRRTGFVEARGNVEITDPQGNRVYGEKIELTDTLKDGLVDNVLLILKDGSRLGARNGNRQAEKTRLDRAIYSPCELCPPGSTEERPLWRIKAVRVTYDQQEKRIRYNDATFEFLNVPILYLPYISHAAPDVARSSGLLLPDLSQSRSLGMSIGTPFFWNIAPDRDLTVTPTFYTSERPTLALDYRQHLRTGPITVGGIATYAAKRDNENVETGGNEVRGYLSASGTLQHTSRWRSTFSGRITTDDTFLRRYDISDDDVLRSNYRLEHFGDRDYFAIQTWGFQGLQRDDRQGLTPIVLPSVDYAWQSRPSLFGGQWSIRANGLSLTRTDGMDSYRLSSTGGWEGRWLTPAGQTLRLVTQTRADLYYVSDTESPDDIVYAGNRGWQGRVLPLAAIETAWPLAGPALGGQQTLEPVVQLIASPNGGNNGIPNEDSRAFDLEDSNLFDLNRFSGFDRWEGGVRLVYGGRWSWSRGKWALSAEGGQSLRFNSNREIFPNGSGLSGNFSDFVGRTTVSWGELIDVTHRFRIDKTSFAARRNEIDAVLGTRRNYVTVGYTYLNRNIDIEDLEDREELRVGGRVQLGRYWALIGSTILDLTSKGENPLTTSDGFEPIRHRVGLVYEDECFSFSVTWKKNFTEDRDFRKGSSVFLRFSLRNLGGGN
ncbi:LPS-assembly protein LptD [Parapedomonas caeni]